MNRTFPSTAAMPLSVFCLLLATVAPGPANGAPSRHVESVTVEAENALPGIWRFPPHERRSDWSELGTDIVAKFAAVGPEKYCRIGRADSGYTFNCLEIAERSPRATLDRLSRVSLSWTVLFGVPGCRWTFRGHLQSETELFGHLGMMCGMVLREKTEPMTITKMALSESTPDAGGHAAYLRRLLEEMANGEVTEPYARPYFYSSDPAAKPLPVDVQPLLFTFLPPYSLQLLGKVTAVIYVAEYYPIVGWRYDEGNPVYSDKQSSIYAVEFENGERLCTLHRRPDGVLDRFQCV